MLTKNICSWIPPQCATLRQQRKSKSILSAMSHLQCNISKLLQGSRHFQLKDTVKGLRIMNHMVTQSFVRRIYAKMTPLRIRINVKYKILEKSICLHFNDCHASGKSLDTNTCLKYWSFPNYHISLYVL